MLHDGCGCCLLGKRSLVWLSVRVCLLMDICCCVLANIRPNDHLGDAGTSYQDDLKPVVDTKKSFPRLLYAKYGRNRQRTFGHFYNFSIIFVASGRVLNTATY